MTMTSTDAATAVSSTNVRLVVVDDARQPRYLRRAADLEAALLAVLADADVDPQDVPGLHGLCVEAVRAAERRTA